MQNIDVRFTATSNFTKVKADLAALEAQAASLGAVFSKNAYASAGGVDPQRWRVASEAVHRASRIYRDAASSSGLLTTQQIRATSQAEKYTQALQKQKLSFADMRKHSGIMKQVYQDQLRYQRMTAQYWGTDMSGRAITDISIPKNVPQELNTAAQRMHFLGQMTMSASTQIINLGKNMQWAGRQLTVGFTYPLTLFGAAAGAMAYKVEDAFGSINKVYNYSSESLQNQTKLEQEQASVRTRSMKMAEQVASQYGVTISKTLDIEQQLAATGLTMSNGLTETTKEIARISALGDIDTTQTTEMVIALKTAFRDTIKDGSDLTNTLNYMNAASNASSLSLQDIAEATPRAATAIAQLGGTVQDMTALLTAMRESGINAAEGANALKSASTRILNPVPKAVEFYQKYNIDIKKLAAEANGNLFDFLKALGEKQQKINGGVEDGVKRSAEFIRAQGVASLFGTYQNNRLTAALVNLNDAYGGVNNQTKEVLRLGELSNKQLAEQAKISQKAMMQTPSAKIRKAWAEFQITLAEMGKPFLTVAAAILKAGNALGNWFNDLSDGTKKLVAVVGIVMGMAGPLVMLGGLFLNLFGQFAGGVGKMMSGVGRLMGAKALLNKEEAAGMATAEAQNKVLQEQSNYTSTLAQETRALTQALEQALIAMKQLSQQNGLNSRSVMLGPQTQQFTYKGKPYQASSMEQSYMNQTRDLFPSGRAPGTHLEYARNRMAEDYMKSMNVVARDASNIDKYNAKVARTSAVITNNMSGAAIAGGLMAASMAAMMISSNKTVDNIAKWTMIGTLVVPALGMALTAIKAVTANAALWVGLQVEATTATFATAGATGVLAGAAATAVGTVKGLAVAFNEALGPIGWIALGLTALGGVFLAIKHHNDEIAKKQQEYIKNQREANAAMESSTETIAQNLGKAAGSWSRIKSTGIGSSGSTGPANATYKAFQYYKTDDQGKKALQSLDLSNETKTAADLTTEFIRLQVVGNLTAKQARDSMAGMLMAAGENYSKAMSMVDDVYTRIGEASKTNWTQPIEDQIVALANTANDALYKVKFTGLAHPGAAGTAGQVRNYGVTEADPVMLAQLQNQAKASALIFNEALANAASPDAARRIIKQYMAGALTEWDRGFNELVASSEPGAEKLRVLFEKYGVTNGKTFSTAFAHNADFTSALRDLQGSGGLSKQLSASIDAATRSGQVFEQTVLRPLRDIIPVLSGARADVTSFFGAFMQGGPSYGTPAKQAAQDLISTSDEMARYKAIREQINALEQRNPGIEGSKKMLGLQLQLNSAGKALTKQINTLNKAYGFAEGRNAGEAMYNLLNHIKVGAKGAADEVNGVGKNLDKLHDKTVNIRINQVGGIIQNAMQGVQEDMATSAMNKFNSGWDATMAHLESTQQAAQQRLENQQQNAQDAFDARWQRRKDAIEKAYQAREDAIKREIDAEQKADDVRQRLFEKEKARLQQLADMANTNIDFNVQLNQGNLDEAAKTLNNAEVKSANDQMDAEQKAAEARSQAKIEALNKKTDRLEKQKDKEMKALEKMEARMRKHLERVQAARSAALQKQQEQETASMQKTRDYEEAMLDQRLTLFKAYTARNQKDLERWMREVGLSYDDFGSDVKAKGEKWSTYFQQSLSDHIRQAGTEVMNDNIWENVGKAMASKLLKGLGFNGLSDFRNFVKTGNLTGLDSKGNKNADSGKTESRHAGGVVGSGLGSRGSIPNTYKGLHPSEKMIRAQKGEYVINRNASAKHKGLLNAINSGSYRGYDGIGGVTGDIGSYNPSYGYGNASALLTGAMARMFFQGTGKAFQNIYQNSKKRNKSSGSHHDEYSGPSGGFVQGAGGRHRPISGPVTNGLHDQYTGYPAVDFAGPIGTPVYAVADGTISRSYDIRGYEPRRVVYGTNQQDGYRSYGRVIYLRTDAGPEVLYAHLSKRSAVAGQRVKGGAKLGARGNTGHVVSSTGNGAHLHFGATNGPYAWLRTGGKIKYDNTPALLHSGESVLTKRLTDRFEQGVTGGGGDTHHVTLDLRGATIKEDVDIERAMDTWWNKKGHRVGRKRVVN